MGGRQQQEVTSETAVLTEVTVTESVIGKKDVVTEVSSAVSVSVMDSVSVVVVVRYWVTTVVGVIEEVREELGWNPA